MITMKKTGIALLVVFIIMLAALLMQKHPKNPDESISLIINNIYKKNPVNAMIYGVWQDGKLIATGAIGESMTDVLAHTEMHFRIGGITETFLTTLLMKYVEQNKVSLDDKVAKWFPAYPEADKVTLKMLANSTSGYPDYVYAKDFDNALLANVFKQWQSRELLQFAFKQPMQFKPGSSQHYSHTNYIILGDILEKIGGANLTRLLNENIIKPLNLLNTHYIVNASMPAPVLHAFSRERGVYEDVTFWSPSWTSSSGMMVSTLNDLGAWAQAFGNGQLINKKSYEQLTAKDTIGLGRNKNDRYFAMGFGVINDWLIQNPSFNGYSGVFAYHPKREMAVIIFNTVKDSKTATKNYSMQAFEELQSIL